jgi:DMSO/TMAO reductase YedYZ molybdopterin-dependent catalytic subunit
MIRHMAVEQKRAIERIAAKRPMLIDRKRVRQVLPAQLTQKVTPVEILFETSSMGVPDVGADDWKLEITGLVDSWVFR